MKIKTLTLLFFVSSCSYLLSQIDKPLVSEEYLPPLKKTDTYCSSKSKSTFELVGSGHHAQKMFSDLLHKHKELDFTDKAVLWSLMQMNIRPDMASPTARLQFMSRTNKGESYWDFMEFPKAGEERDSYPFLDGLQQWLIQNGKKRSLESYADLLDQSLKGHFVVTEELEETLLTKKELLKKNPIFQKLFFRGDEVLRTSERMPRLSFRQTLELWRSHKGLARAQNQLFGHESKGEVVGLCNYDFSLYDRSIYLIDEVINPGHIFGVIDGESAFMAVTSQGLKNFSPLNSGPLFKGTSRTRAPAICQIKHDKGQSWFISLKSRDPGQHLYHLFRYGLHRTSDIQDVDRFIRHARHLFLSDPIRLVVESRRSRPEQIQELLKLNIPVYNAKSLGQIWGYGHFKNSQAHFIIDERQPGALYCSY